MTTVLRRTLAAVAVASLVTTAVAATAQAQADSSPRMAPVADAEPATGSSAVDSGSAAARSAPGLIERGDIIGLIALIGVAPFQMLTSGVCDLATMSALPDPCSPGPAHYG